MRMNGKARVPVQIALFAGILGMIPSAVMATAQVAPAVQSKLALMPLPSSITQSEGALTVTAAGGVGSIFTYRYDQTHDVRLEAAVKRTLLQLGRTCGGDVLRSTVDHPVPANPSLTISVAGTSAPVQTVNEDESYQLNITPQGANRKRRLIPVRCMTGDDPNRPQTSAVPACRQQ
jgi:hexosaminidase